jgi:hypothetical protein
MAMKFKTKIYSFVLAAAAMLFASDGFSQANPEHFFRAAGTPHNPKVQTAWNRYYTYDGIVDIMQKIARAYPDLAKLESIGKSYEGRDLWMLTITNFKGGGDVKRKPAMYIDGNIHSNEIQGSEFSLYTAWYLTETFNDIPFIKELLTEKVFYIVPTINPDGREDYMRKANTASSPRSGMIPLDNDRDHMIGEDGYDDLNGDGHITQMRRKNPNGRFIVDRNDPRRMIPVAPGQKGEYELLGLEGIDNDGDGQISEDRITGVYDPNRDWGWNWQPNYIQGGAWKYPFSQPENRAVMEFAMKHPNIAAAQSYHNSGGMILRGPGAQEDLPTYDRNDVMVYDIIGQKGESMIPGYRYLVVYKDLYSVFGGELDWFHGGRGVFTYTNELWTGYFYYNSGGRAGGGGGGQDSQYDFEKDLLFGDAFVEWKEYDHPQFGKVEIGGFKKNFGRNHPGFLLEQDAHRNMAFTIFHAYHTPKLSIQSISEKDLGGGLKEITAVIENERLIPTHSSHDLKYKIERPDYVSISGGPKVITGMIVQNEDFNRVEEQTYNPAKMEVANIPGNSTVTVRWIVSGGGNYTITVDSAKGGVVSKSK